MKTAKNAFVSLLRKLYLHLAQGLEGNGGPLQSCLVAGEVQGEVLRLAGTQHSR